MTSWFLDASVLIAARDLGDPHHGAAERLLAGEEPMHTLDLAHYECANTAIGRWRDETAASHLRSMIQAIEDAGGLLRVDAQLAAELSTVAHRHGLSAYDAGYVAGAARVGATLVSCDLRDLVRPGHAVTPEQALAG